MKRDNFIGTRFGQLTVISPGYANVIVETRQLPMELI